ncbi:MAG: bifunctional 2-polyprenyl-6-hydroxyphenol methylase/3-demethylubiquinol 3-O-methyltransferase UbiG [Rubricoccaceae bacterium]
MREVNNAFYDDLGARWFEGDDHAIALLRAESRIKIAYVREVFAREGLGAGTSVLDVACGAGLVSLPLARLGYRVTGLDLAEGAIAEAQRRAPEGARYRVGDAYATGEPDAAHDAVLLMDMLEHVERPDDVLAEAARVVRPGGLVLYHTFNQTPAAWLLAIHGIRVVARDTPPDLHVYRLFLPPDRLAAMAAAAGLDARETRGVRPVLDGAFWRSVRRRRVDPAFRFAHTRALAVGYCGYAARVR